MQYSIPSDNMFNRDIPHLLTYPRSGSHYFDDILYEEEKIHFTKSHFLDELFDKNNNKIRKIITISRDPVDSISSYVGLYNGFGLYPVGHEYLFQEKITEYVLMYSFLCEHADYVIDFNDLLQHPKPVIKKILKLLDINKNKYNIFDNNIIPRHENFKPSSKSLPHYDKSMLDNFDLSLCYYYYYKLLEKKIIV
jgi:hypothetical protein